MSLVAAYLAAHALELLGAATAVLGIALTARRKLLCWPVTLVSIVIYTLVFLRARLYSDALLQLFFVVFTLYGWWHWLRGVRHEGEVRVEPLAGRSLALALALGVVGSVALGSLAMRIHAALPHLDATLMSYSLVASWWQARKHIANWWLWIVVDLVYIGEYIYKDLWPTAILYAILIALAVVGLRDWRRAARVSAQGNSRFKLDATPLSS
jgi:nicotinamide mononucleotide transporter